MAKELPYFKFEPNAWDTGNIQMCSRETKGLFTDMCSLYWSRLGEVPYALALQKLCNGNKDALQELIDHEIIGVIDGQIIIEFLDEQLSEFNETSEKRRNAANKRWKDASALHLQSKSNAIREDKIREEEKKEDKTKIDVLPFSSDQFAFAWNEWISYKKEKKQKLTQKTKEMQLRTLGARPEQEAIGMIGQSIQNGWTGLFEFKDKQNGKSITAQGTLDRLNSYRTKS
jgi:hypothetical protein